MSDTNTDDEFRMSLLTYDLRTRRTSLAHQLHIDWESLKLSTSPDRELRSSSETSPAASPLSPLPPPARQRGSSVLQGIAPSWLNLERGGIQIGNTLIRPSIQFRPLGGTVQLIWSR